MPHVAVTGITGFLGTALAARLVDQGWRVTGLARPSSSPATRAWLTSLGVTLVPGDVLDPPPRLERFLGGADLLIHSAAVIGYRQRLAGIMQRTNVLGTRGVLAAARRVGLPRAVHVSSIAALGFADEPVVLDEEHPWNGHLLDAAYFDTKHAAEQEVAAAADAGLDVTMVNPGAIYGPSLAASNSSNVIVQILTGRVPLVPRGGINVVPLDTVVETVLAAAERGGLARRHVPPGENLTIRQLVQRVGRADDRALDARELPRGLVRLVRPLMEAVEPLVPDRVWYTPDMCAVADRWMWFDGLRAREALGVAPGDLDACLRDTVLQLRRDGRLADGAAAG